MYVFAEYASTTGNAMSTKINAQARAHAALGGRTYVIASERRTHDYADGDMVLYRSRRRPDREWFTDNERRIDAALGASLGWRPMIRRFHGDAIRAIPTDTRVTVLYNYAGAVPEVRRHVGETLVLHLGNDVFRHWRPRDIRRVVEMSDLTVTVSDHLAEVIRRQARAPMARLKVLRNGVDTSLFYPATHRSSAQPPVFLFVGNIAPHKGPGHLIAAALEVARSRPNFRVRIVGSAGLRPTESLTQYEVGLRQMAAPLGDTVEFLPFVTRQKLPEVFRQASVFCMPVVWDEPAGQVVSEAMASGLPVISARRGGIPEYLGPEGYYVDPEDSRAFADAMVAMLELGEKGRELVGRSLRRRTERMTWDDNMKQFLRMVDGPTESI
jgi:glycosyltransferase involved in cell wall biosynthesis